MFITITLSGVLTLNATAVGPPSNAETIAGNYDLLISGRYDFHTWVWSVYAPPPGACAPGCVHIAAIPRPVAKAAEYQGDAPLNGGRYVLRIDDPFGLRCGDIYYGPVILTHDTYSWDAITQHGTVESTFDTNCGGGPGGTYTYPFTLSRM